MTATGRQRRIDAAWLTAGADVPAKSVDGLAHIPQVCAIAKMLAWFKNVLVYLIGF